VDGGGGAALPWVAREVSLSPRPARVNAALRGCAQSSTIRHVNVIAFTKNKRGGRVLRQHWPRPSMSESPRERLLREWSAARTEKEKARILAQWIELFPDQQPARAR